MRFNLHYILSAAFLLNVFYTLATEPYYNDRFNQANEAYKAGAYDSAKSIYNEIAENGIISTALFYNLGNVHYRMGNIPEAILYFERAIRLAPYDEDIRYNLEIAKGFLVDKIEVAEPFLIEKLWIEMARTFKADTWGIMAIGLLLLACALFTAFAVSSIRQVKQMGFLGGFVLAIGVIMLILLARTSENELNKNEGIVFAESITVKSEPGLQGQDQFVIHEGIKVLITGTEGDWTKIKLEDGNSGWLPSTSIVRI
jgi:tetratricopeptide (TPR) repeat protein